MATHSLFSGGGRTAEGLRPSPRVRRHYLSPVGRLLDGGQCYRVFLDRFGKLWTFDDGGAPGGLLALVIGEDQVTPDDQWADRTIRDAKDGRWADYLS